MVTAVGTRLDWLQWPELRSGLPWGAIDVHASPNTRLRSIWERHGTSQPQLYRFAKQCSLVCKLVQSSAHCLASLAIVSLLPVISGLFPSVGLWLSRSME